MPCYDSRNDEPQKSEWEEHCAKAGYAKGDFEQFYDNVTKRMLEQWLCDALRGYRSEHCRKWWEMHKQKNGEA